MDYYGKQHEIQATKSPRMDVREQWQRRMETYSHTRHGLYTQKKKKKLSFLHEVDLGRKYYCDSLLFFTSNLFILFRISFHFVQHRFWKNKSLILFPNPFKICFYILQAHIRQIVVLSPYIRLDQDIRYSSIIH